MIHFDFAPLPNGVRLHYARAGEGRPLLFLHGFPEFWYEWKGQLEAFQHSHCAVAPDLRGFNLSSKPAEVRDYRAKHLVEDIRLLADHLGWTRFTLVAHDWGGAVAWSFAAAHPERLERLVVINAPHAATFARELRDNPAQQVASSYMNLFREARAEALLAEADCRRLFAMTIDAWARNGGRGDAEIRAAYRAAWSQPGALTGALNYYRASPLHPPTPEEPSVPQIDAAAFHVRVPTLVIWGEQDQALLLGNLQGLEQHVDSLVVRRVPDASHWIVHERPALVTQAIAEFIGP